MQTHNFRAHWHRRGHLGVRENQRSRACGKSWRRMQHRRKAKRRSVKHPMMSTSRSTLKLKTHCRHKQGKEKEKGGAESERHGGAGGGWACLVDPQNIVAQAPVHSCTLLRLASITKLAQTIGLVPFGVRPTLAILNGSSLSWCGARPPLGHALTAAQETAMPCNTKTSHTATEST